MSNIKSQAGLLSEKCAIRRFSVPKTILRFLAPPAEWSSSFGRAKINFVTGTKFIKRERERRRDPRAMAERAPRYLTLCILGNWFLEPLKTIAMREQLISFLADNGCADIIDAKKFKKYPKKDFNVDSDAMLLFQDPPDSLPHIPGYERSSVYTEIDIFGRNK